MFIGDFNSNTIWDNKKHRLGSHSSVVKQLENKDGFSALTGFLISIINQIHKGAEEHHDILGMYAGTQGFFQRRITLNCQSFVSTAMLENETSNR